MVHPIAQAFPWRRLLTRPQLQPSKVHDLSLRCIRRIEEWGIRVPNGTRLRNVEAVLRAWASHDAPTTDPVTRLRIAEGVRTALEMYFATHGIQGQPSAAMREKLTQALLGADLPTEERQHFARDIQFELYVHGTLAAGGVAPWFDERPDLRVRYGDDTVGVAVKRLWSKKGAHTQLSRAAGQIEESELRGIIATNAQEYLAIVPTDDSIEAKGTAFNEQIARLHGQFPYLAKKAHILGLMICGTVAEWAAEGESGAALRIATYSQLFVLDAEDEGAYAHGFFGGLGDSLAEWLKNNM